MDRIPVHPPHIPRVGWLESGNPSNSSGDPSAQNPTFALISHTIFCILPPPYDRITASLNVSFWSSNARSDRSNN
ncbi:MAG: hypothetical protein ABIJ65_12245, partial [Chloroflexota bacterium]